MNPAYQKKYLKINDKTLLNNFYQTQTFFKYSYFSVSWPRGKHGTNQYNSSTKLGILSRDGMLEMKW